MTLEGELIQQRIPSLLDQLEALAAAERIDLSGVSRADSAGLAFLLAIVRRGRARGRAPELHSPSPQLRQLAGFFGLDPTLGLS